MNRLFSHGSRKGPSLVIVNSRLRSSLTLPSERVAHSVLILDFRPFAVAPLRSGCEGYLPSVRLLFGLSGAEIAEGQVHPPSVVPEQPFERDILCFPVSLEREAVQPFLF